MDVTFYCTSCAKKYRLDEKFVGRKVTCKACGSVRRVPPESELAPPDVLTAVTGTGAAATPATMPDPDCFALVEEEPPAAVARPVAKSTRPATRANPAEAPKTHDRPAPARKKIVIPGEVDVGEYHLKEELEPWAHNAMKAGGPCPDCGKEAKPKVILCTGCGLNFKTGEKVPPPPSTTITVTPQGKRGFWPFRRAAAGETDAEVPRG